MQDQTRPSESSAKFLFRVRFSNGASGEFEEFTDLGPDEGGTEYRHGNSPVFYPIKMPGLGRVGNIALRRGFFVNDDAFKALYNGFKAGSNERYRIVIDLVDGANAVTTTWTLNNAWPTMIGVVDMYADMNEAVVQELGIAFEELTVFTPSTSQPQ